MTATLPRNLGIPVRQSTRIPDFKFLNQPRPQSCHCEPAEYAIMGSLSIVALSLLLVWITSHLWTFRRNYHAARATGVPMIVCLYDPDSVSAAPKYSY